jgi:hypothetical protein
MPMISADHRISGSGGARGSRRRLCGGGRARCVNAGRVCGQTPSNAGAQRIIITVLYIIKINP